MTPEEIETIVKTAAELGIKKVKLTGGEPLVRDDIVEIIERISPYLKEVSMTTNASLLADKANQLKEAGLKRVNISLHTLNPDTFKKITKRDCRNDVTKGINAALDCGLQPVKLNMVVMNGVNSEEIPSLIDYCRKTGTILQLIEFQELENGVDYYDQFHFDLKALEQDLVGMSDKIIKRELHHRKIYYLRSGVKVEIVRPMHNSEFCAYCTRIRLTSDGRLKACLMREDNLIPLIGLIRGGGTEEEITGLFKKAIEQREPFWRDQYGSHS
jgi:cyclic pyranopterin phosphate synthase